MDKVSQLLKNFFIGTWHYSKSVFFLIMFFIVMVIAEIPLILAEGDEEFPAVISDFRAFQIMVITTILVALFFVIRYRKQLKGHNPNQFNQPVISKKRKIIFTVIMLIVYFSTDIIFQGFLPMESPENQVMIETSFKAIPFTISLMTCVFAPITEEFIFRGFFFNYFFNCNNRLCNGVVVIVSGLVFGLMHEAALTPALLIYASSGWVLGATYMYTKDLRCSMFIHFVGNTVATIAMFFTL